MRHEGGRWAHWEGEKGPTVAVVFEREDFSAFPVDKATKRLWRPREHDLGAFVAAIRRELAAARGVFGPTIRHVADAVEQLDDGAVYSVGLTEDREPGGGDFAVIFSAREPDRDGSGYAVVVEPGRRTAYAAVESCRLDRTSLRLRLTEEAAATLDLPRDAMLRLDVSDDELRLLARGLQRVGVKPPPASS